MPLSKGDRLGPYEIIDLLGKGGMGEVYRAHDKNLARDVAIKVLPAALAQDPDRLARFEREAKVLAAMNHPNIAIIYGLEYTATNARAIVMELVEGPTLADRLEKGALPLNETLSIARQIADALEAAHEKGVVHRDLKPANVKVREDGTVKVLDFGLATAVLTGVRDAGHGADSPTLTLGATQAGMILGTAAYMAPEQAEGKPVDRRADIWSFGVVVWEMVTGKRLFHADTVPLTLADVLRKEVDFTQLPEGTPAPVSELLKRCLDRDVKSRLRDIGEARVAIQRYLANPVSETEAPPQAEAPLSPSRRAWLWPSVAALCALLAAAVSSVHFRETPPDPPKPVRFQFAPENLTMAGAFRFALSPDGTKLAYFATGSVSATRSAAGNATGGDGQVRLWIRSMDTLESRALTATDVRPTVPIFWSFDSKFVVFQAPEKLKKIDVSGGPAQTLCDVTGTVVGGSWSRDGVILFGRNNGPLMRVSPEGGTATPVTELDPASGESAHLGPVFLPDGRHFLYWRAGKPESEGIYVGSLDDKPGQPTRKRLLATDHPVEFVPSPDGDSGRILVLREGTLLAQSFDLRKLELVGETVPVAEQVANFLGAGQFSASQNGILVYRTGGSAEYARLTWFDRQGKNLGAASDAGYTITSLAVSPEGSRVAAVRSDGRTLANLWVLDFARGGQTRLTFTQTRGGDAYAAWSPDGTRIAFSSLRAGHWDLYQRAANGAGEDELLLKSDNDKYVNDWSRDGRVLMFTELNSRGTRDLWVLPMTGEGERKSLPFLRTDFDQREGRFSPDGRWVAYRSVESGRAEIYVRPFPPPPGGGGKWMVSQGGANEPRWRRDGRELFYVTTDGQLMVSEVNGAGAAFQSSPPKLLFRAVRATPFEVNADGTRFLFPIIGGDTTQYPFTVVLNWMGPLKR